MHVPAGSRAISLTCVLTPCRMIGVCVTLMTLGAIGAAVWAVGQTTFQVNSADQHLRVFDSTQKRWRQVCSSSANELLASISCEEVVCCMNYSVTSVQEASGDGGDFFCVRQEELSFGASFSTQDILAQNLYVLCQWDTGRAMLPGCSGVTIEYLFHSWLRIKNMGHLCIYLFHTFHARRYRFVNRWRVLLGSIYNKPVNANVVEVKTIVYHSSYLPFVDANIDDNSRDIAVLALTQPLTFNEYVQPICLPAYGQRLIDGQMGTVTGWGNVGYYGHLADVLQEANVPIISDAVCNTPDYYDNQITTSMFCAGYEKGGTDACQGDSGGPFVAEDCLSKTSRYRLLGVVSWGTGCAMPKKPGVYTRVSRFLPWISTAMRVRDWTPCILLY
uniref:Peptidase S1 domain-containing protein n=1 Tax=Monopterus albus TaxID=43700 RepID=A0A3Q3IMU0_MONAL